MSAITEKSTDCEAKQLVSYLHSFAGFIRKHGGRLLIGEANTMADAASLLDSYRAGVALVDPHPITAAELVRWVSVDAALPDADITVLLVITGNDEVRLGFYDGAEWRDADAMPIRGQVLHWADMPAGPQRPDVVEEQPE